MNTNIKITNKNNNFDNDFVYIYNFEQAYFYIENKVRPQSIDKHNKTNNIYFKFRRNDTRELFNIWANRNR